MYLGLLNLRISVGGYRTRWAASFSQTPNAVEIHAA